MTDANNCVSTDDVILTGIGLPNADAGADVWVSGLRCAAEPGSGGGFYGWAPSTGLNDRTVPLRSPPGQHDHLCSP
ncbi:MAG: hypothetical protein IPN38_20205 [Flavobacteriales bacterium]|nr:hypothetical protein [Flavobacteriales bacterium]